MTRRLALALAALAAAFAFIFFMSGRASASTQVTQTPDNTYGLGHPVYAYCNYTFTGSGQRFDDDTHNYPTHFISYTYHESCNIPVKITTGSTTTTVGSVRFTTPGWNLTTGAATDSGCWSPGPTCTGFAFSNANTVCVNVSTHPGQAQYTVTDHLADYQIEPPSYYFGDNDTQWYDGRNDDGTGVGGPHDSAGVNYFFSDGSCANGIGLSGNGGSATAFHNAGSANAYPLYPQTYWIGGTPGPRRRGSTATTSGAASDSRR